MVGELKPCPFCGARAVLEYNQGNENWPKKWWCKCTCCGLALAAHCGSSSWEHRSAATATADKKAEHDAIAAWNRRTPVAAPPARSHCQNGGDVCLAGNRDGVCCPNDSCDIDDGVRKLPVAASVSAPSGCVDSEASRAACEAYCKGKKHGNFTQRELIEPAWSAAVAFALAWQASQGAAVESAARPAAQASDDEVENVAIALWECMRVRVRYWSDPGQWCDVRIAQQERWRMYARAAIAAQTENSNG